MLKHYVGFISTPKLQPQILPKIFHDLSACGTPDQEVEFSAQLLMRLLHYSGFLSVRELPSPQLMQRLDYEQFLKLYVRHVHRSYEDKEDILQFIKGKILFQPSLRQNYGLRHAHMVTYQEFTEDTLLNQIFKTVMLIIGQKTKSADNQKKLARALIYLEDVSRIKLTSEVFNRVKFSKIVLFPMLCQGYMKETIRCLHS